MRFFIPKDKNVEKFGIFEGNSPNLEVIYPTQPNPTQPNSSNEKTLPHLTWVKKNWPRPKTNLLFTGSYFRLKISMKLEDRFGLYEN